MGYYLIYGANGKKCSGRGKRCKDWIIWIPGKFSYQKKKRIGPERYDVIVDRDIKTHPISEEAHAWAASLARRLPQFIEEQEASHVSYGWTFGSLESAVNFANKLKERLCK